MIGTVPTTPKERIRHRLHIYRLALEQNEKGDARAKVLKGYIRDHELRLEAILNAEEAERVRIQAEADKREG